MLPLKYGKIKVIHRYTNCVSVSGCVYLFLCVSVCRGVCVCARARVRVGGCVQLKQQNSQFRFGRKFHISLLSSENVNRLCLLNGINYNQCVHMYVCVCVYVCVCTCVLCVRTAWVYDAIEVLRNSSRRPAKYTERDTGIDS